MDYVFDYLLFLFQAVTVVVALLVVISAMVNASQKAQGGAEQGHLVVTKLNERLRGLRYAMEDALLPADAVKKRHKQEAKQEAKASKAQTAELKAQSEQTDEAYEATRKPRAFVLRFEGDVRASHIDHMRLEVSAVLTMAGAQDEVVVCVESPGGMVHSYGLAASQLTRIRNQQIPLTVVVDKVAASGGYMMAAVANRVVAAPFALLGSIGVVAQVPNVHRLLKKNDVDVEVLTAGKYKRTLTTLGENTEEGRQKFIEELEDVHALFQEFVAEHRPQVDIERVSTGEAWYGKRALDLKLVDELATSDEYLSRLCDTRDVFEVKWEEHKKPIDRLLGRINGTIAQLEQLLSGYRGG